MRSLASTIYPVVLMFLATDLTRAGDENLKPSADQENQRRFREAWAKTTHFYERGQYVEAERAASEAKSIGESLFLTDRARVIEVGEMHSALTAIRQLPPAKLEALADAERTLQLASNESLEGRFIQAAEKSSEAVDTLGEILGRQNYFAYSAHIERLQYYALAFNNEKAIPFCDSAEKYCLRKYGKRCSLYAVVQRAKSYAYQTKADWKNAIQCAAESAQITGDLFPNGQEHVVTLVQLAVVQAMAKEVDGALETSGRACRIVDSKKNPTSDITACRAYNLRGQILNQAGMPEEACVALRRAIRLAQLLKDVKVSDEEMSKMKDLLEACLKAGATKAKNGGTQS